MAMDPAATASALESGLRAVGTPERAASEKRYLKSDLEFLGATAGQTRAAVKAIARSDDLDHEAVVALAEALWDVPIFERRAAAAILLQLSPKQLGPRDLPYLERLIRGAGTWALVDAMAVDVVGGIRIADPSVEPILDRWATDHDFWVRRASLLAELRAVKGGGDLAPFLRRADLMLDEREFFIRKAVGWVLREVAKRRPEDVVAWLAPRTGRASGVTMREAVRYLSPSDTDRLMTGYRERRPA